MKKLKKILFISLLLSFSVFDVIFAEGDCDSFAILQYDHEWSEVNWFEIVDNVWETDKNEYTKFLTSKEQTAIISKNDLNTALLNLKKYCCKNNKWELWDVCEKDLPYFNDNALDSPYLFDHLFDVIMRRLKWLGGSKNIYTRTQMTLDDKWALWRSLIDEHAESLQWAAPQIIIDEYSSFWTKSPAGSGFDIREKTKSTFGLNNQNFLMYMKWGADNEESNQVANALKKYNEWTLYDRYNNACALSRYFYWLLSLWSRSSEKNDLIWETALNNCENFVINQINLENKYVMVVTERATNRFLSNYFDWYIAYMYDRQQRFEKLRIDSTDRWLDVFRAIPCLQKRCTH